MRIARAEGRVSVEDLARRFAVTPQTIRRDLSHLSDAGLLEREHGGAVLKDDAPRRAYDQRRRLNEAAKTAIARACAAAIPANASLILNLGTTTEAVARALLHHANLTVVTNNVAVANILLANPGCEVVLAGGTLRRSDGGVVGVLTTRFLTQFKVDYAVIGCSAIDGSGDLLGFDPAGVQVSKAIIARSRATFLVADQSKFQPTAPETPRPAAARVASLADVATFFTDAPLPHPLAAKCQTWATQIHLT